MKVTLFIPCLVDQFAPNVGICTYNILKKLGCEINFPFEQTCCGQPAYNTGYHYEAKILAERFLRLFKNSKFIVAPSGSCVAMVKNYYGNLELTNEYQDIYQDLRNRIYEFSDFLVNVLNITDFNTKLNKKVTYHQSCHLLRELRISEEPKILIKNIRGIEFIEMNESDRCCGFGGTFAVKFPELSNFLTEEKVANIEATGAQFVVSNDVSCLLNIEGVIKRKKLKVRTVHIAELLMMGE